MIQISLMITILVDVILVILLFIEHLMQNTLEAKKRIENDIMPEWKFQDPFENKTKNLYDPKPLREIAREITKLDDK